ncbi:MAG TPA: wax ester/triacylglycerol synthase family O-acyltransferase [Casimicrobiaceae bacterium]|nr:wax ester/triacylglycerol synthase family O-acyltransferase [Casimicrobiaceae bacterium]
MAATSRREKVSAVDTAWLRMDRPHNLMMITGVLMFRERLPIARLKRLVAERFLVFRRFRQRPVESAGMAFWETARDFDLDRHVVHTALPAPAGRRELQSLVSRLATVPLDPAHPRWQFHLVDNLDGGSALIVRIHHSYADGIALVRVMLSMTDAAERGPPAMPFEPPARRRAASDDDPFAQLLQPFAGVLATARRIGGALVDKGVELWTDPSKAIELANQGGALTAEIANLTLMEQDSPTRFKGKPAVAKRVAWAEALPLDEVKTIGRALGGSVNDVLLSCVAGALGRYLRDKGDDTDGVTLRALVPVNLRPIEKAYRLGNQFGLVFLDLPIGIENPVERLYAVRDNMAALKGSHQPVLALGILAAMGAGPRILQETLLSILARNASAVMTNVPGPQQPLWFAGARIDSLMFWVPQSGDIGMGVSILSYDGKAQFGVITDKGLCPDPGSITERVGREFETLVLAALMCPWGIDGDLDPRKVARAVGIRA